MFTIYVLQSINHDFRYVGFTSNIERRLYDHNNGFNKSTKHYKPFKLVYSETCQTRLEARRREKYLKSTHGRKFLAKVIRKDAPAQTQAPSV